MKERSRSFGVLADDLTGAMDTGVAFARAGLRTVVSFGVPPGTSPDVLVVTTDSRAEGPLVAVRKVKQAARSLAGRYVYKKIDSTLRGNVGVEIRAALETLNLARAVVSPAFPGSGRTVLGGRLLVNGKPLEETGFAHDPASPVVTSRHSRAIRKAERPRGGQHRPLRGGAGAAPPQPEAGGLPGTAGCGGCLNADSSDISGRGAGYD